ncbi:MAG: acyl-CoA desaturase, partial [Pseudomonadota bacterium]|nr:acyl-CoA desaturase [Pseudomonadota bacterium]
MKTMNEQQLAELENDLNAIRDEVLADLGERDARYIRRIVRLHRGLEIGGRVLMPFGFIPPVFVAATAALGLSKIIENMEIGHNVMHGQYDWMGDPAINSKTFDWDNTCTNKAWKHTHNFEHHTFTNVLDKDHDIGYGILRMSEDQEWEPRFLFNPILAGILATFFQHFVAVQS